MDKEKNEQLKKSLQDKRRVLLTQVKDKHFAEHLLDEMMSLKGQIAIEPAHYVVGIDDVISTYESDEYTITSLLNGVHFHTKGGFDIFIDAKYRAACGLLTDIVSFKEHESELSEEEKKDYATTLKNLMYVLCAPLWVLGSQAMTTFMGNALLVMLSAQEEWMSQDDEEKRKKPIPTRLIASRVKEMCDMLLTHIDAQNGKETGQTEEGKKEEE